MVEHARRSADEVCVDAWPVSRHPCGVQDPAVKAAGLNTLVRVVRARANAERFAAAIRELPDDVRRLIDQPPLPMEWIALDRGTALEDALCAALGNDLAAVTEASAEASREDLGTIYRAFMKLASPKYVAGRAAAIYATYTRGSGAMQVVAETERTVDIALEGVLRPTANFYALRRGNILGALRATGAAGAACQVVRGGGRTSSAVYRASWD